LVLENRRLERQLDDSRQQRSRFFGLVGAHPSMRALYTLIETVAHQTDPVLIIGETGTGKELVARAVHELGLHGQAPYVAVNMAALPAEMIESELFGHEKGAFTGAVQRKIGKFEYAGEGSLFLDEICSMPASLQAKLLRVLEERSFNRLGGNAAIPLRARIIAASNRDLEVEIERGGFRQDLYYRLNVLPVRLPPLRERREDIPLLVAHFWREFCDDHAGGGQPCPPELVGQMEQRDWPGNIRELRNAVRRYCVLGDSGPTASVQPTAHAEAGAGAIRPWRAHMEEEERRYLEQALRLAGGRVNLACTRMDISRKSLYDKINKYGIELARFRRGSGPERSG
jgi:two-component system C4-dicarboxylate transport response regulator DctD